MENNTVGTGENPKAKALIEIAELLNDADEETIEILQFMYLGWLESGLSDGLSKQKRVNSYYIIYSICRIISKYKHISD